MNAYHSSTVVLLIYIYLRVWQKVEDIFNFNASKYLLDHLCLEDLLINKLKDVGIFIPLYKYG